MLNPEQIRKLVANKIKACKGNKLKLKKIDNDCQNLLGFAWQIEAGKTEKEFYEQCAAYKNEITAIIKNYEALVKDGYKKIAKNWLEHSDLNRLKGERDALMKILQINQ